MVQPAIAVPMEFSSQAMPAGALAEVFAAFMEASGRLERSYSELQAQVADLRMALQQRTEEKAALSALLQEIVQALPCGIVATREDGSVVLKNAEAARLLALAEASLPQETSAGPDLLLSWNSHGSSPEPLPVQRQICFQSSTQTHWIQLGERLLARPTSISSGPRLHRMLILEDISRLKEQEKLQEEGQKHRALAHMAAMLAHEIRNPLAGIELFTELLQDGVREGQEHLFQHLRMGVRTLSGLVNNVLALNGEALLERVEVEVGDELAAVAELLQPFAEQAGIRLLYGCDADLPPVLSNRSALHQLLLNLGRNALRHTPPEGKVEFRACKLAGNGVQISVRDNGCGISPRIRHKVFEAGFSADGKRSGLGLAVCKRLMQEHGGSIRVESDPGGGSHFILEFPAV